MSLPEKITIREVGPREGFQTHKAVVSTENKLRLIEALVKTGVSTVEVTSFVRPDRVPQMADARTVCSKLKKSAGTKFTALYLNKKGFTEAENFSQLSNQGWVYTAGSESFLLRNNNLSIAQSVENMPGWLELFSQHKKQLHGLMISAAFGCNEEGAVGADQIVTLVSKFTNKISETESHSDQKLLEVCLADTVGWATPEDVKATVAKLKARFPEIIVSLHLHDTRGAGLANAYAGLQEGVSCFDSSVGGIGGCPFAKGAAGNIASEDLIFMCQRMGISTDINLDCYIDAARIAGEILGQPLPGKLYKAWKSIKRD